MIQYIYFVKCPNCEDEHFDFFDEAKAYALGCLGNKPIITQIEVDRNDFGECTDSSDLGQVWSWEDEVGEPEAEPATVFAKDDIKTAYDPDTDPEFQDDDFFAINSEEPTAEPSAEDNSDNLRKPIPDGMTIEDLVEEMEENEDTVECTWCNDLFDKSECRYEVDLGWLCSRCEMAIKSRGETLTFKENNYWDFLDEETKEPESVHDLGNTYDGGYPEEAPKDLELEEAAQPSEKVELDYDALTITLCGNQRDVDDWDEVEHTDSYTYEVDKDDVATTIWENFITEEDVADVPGGLEALEDDAAWEKFLETHFDTLFEKYYNKLLDYYEEYATEDFQDNYSFSDYQADREADYGDWLYHSRKDDMLEKLEEADDYSKRLEACPECGDKSYDAATGFCIHCGFN